MGMTAMHDELIKQKAGLNWSKMSYSEWERHVVELLEAPVPSEKGLSDEKVKDQREFLAQRRKILVQAFQGLDAEALHWAFIESKVSARFTQAFKRLSTSFQNELKAIIQKKDHRHDFQPKVKDVEAPRNATSPPTPAPRQRRCRASLDGIHDTLRLNDPCVREAWGELFSGFVGQISYYAKNPQYIPGAVVTSALPPTLLSMYRRDSVVAEILTGTDDLAYLYVDGPYYGPAALKRFNDRVARRVGAAIEHQQYMLRPVEAIGGATAGITRGMRVRQRPHIGPPRRLPPGGGDGGGGGGGGQKALPPGDLPIGPARQLTAGKAIDPQWYQQAWNWIANYRRTLARRNAARNIAVSRLELEGQPPIDRGVALSGQRPVAGAIESPTAPGAGTYNKPSSMPRRSGTSCRRPALRQRSQAARERRKRFSPPIPARRVYCGFSVNTNPVLRARDRSTGFERSGKGKSRSMWMPSFRPEHLEPSYSDVIPANARSLVQTVMKPQSNR